MGGRVPFTISKPVLELANVDDISSKISTTSVSNLIDLSELRSCYDDIIKNMPDNYYETVQLLERELCDTHISSIFECSHFTAANQIILECLMEQVNCKEDILDLCERLLRLKNASQLTTITENLRMAVVHNLQTAHPQQQQQQQHHHHHHHHHHHQKQQKQQESKPSGQNSAGQSLLSTSKDLDNRVNTMNHKLKGVHRGPEEIVTPKDLVKCAKQIATKWKNIGYELGLEPQDIDIIAADNPTSCEEACKSMLFKWYRKNAQPTFGMLDRAIKSCKNISGFNFQPPPLLPRNHIERHGLLKRMAGYGKSTLAKVLCHQSSIKNHFSGRVVWIQLGPIPKMRPVSMLLLIYSKLTGKQWTPIAPSVQATLTDEETLAGLSEALQTLCSSENVLVIVDDVWEVEDACTYIETFCGCKIVITTRRKDFTQFFECKHEILVEGMTTTDAIDLLTIKEFQPVNISIIDQLSQLAKRLYYWPLLLNLVHGQFQMHYHRIPNISSATIIENTSQKLFDYGLTAFDPRGILKHQKEMAATACIKASLDCLEQTDLIRLVKLVTSYHIW
ncbi:uncharacterized protein [Dysidea avara]|uniref:uncharacterized protein isoform X2 n=1 Tax=Dysidea avara TaxID=196820 RepID=UPI00331792CE